MVSELMKIFPAELREKFKGIDLCKESYTELRFRCNGPVMLLKGREEKFLHKNGGICTDEFDPMTMESRLVPGLYACGEVLDIDGDCGGYNLQWAWSSGLLAGCSAGGNV